MKMTQLGTKGPEVSAIGLGCMGMTGAYGATSAEEGIATIQAAVDRGVTLIDTGDFYDSGANELLVGRALAPTAALSFLAVGLGATFGIAAALLSAGPFLGARRAWVHRATLFTASVPLLAFAPITAALLFFPLDGPTPRDATHDFVVYTSFIVVTYASVALLERWFPYRAEWNRPAGDLRADSLHLGITGPVFGQLGAAAALGLHGQVA